MIKQTAITVIGAAALATSAQAEVEYDVSVGFHSDYLFRGINQFGGQLLDTSVTASKEYKGFTYSANVWYGTTGTFGLDELDVTLAVEKSTSFATYNAGVIGYYFPDASGANTYELFVGISKELFSGITGSATYYNDIDLLESNFDDYFEFGLSKDLEFGYINPTLDLAAGYIAGPNRFTHYQATLSTSHEISANATISPYLTYVVQDGNASFNGDTDELVGGVSVSVGF